MSCQRRHVWWHGIYACGLQASLLPFSLIAGEDPRSPIPMYYACAFSLIRKDERIKADIIGPNAQSGRFPAMSTTPPAQPGLA
ncbi:MAG: hypothetical protein J6P83_08395 [Bacteroidales bacterium]|nr:hypothetical protein [Bacteroidales bacterium]